MFSLMGQSRIGQGKQKRSATASKNVVHVREGFEGRLRKKASITQPYQSWSRCGYHFILRSHHDDAVELTKGENERRRLRTHKTENQGHEERDRQLYSSHTRRMMISTAASFAAAWRFDVTGLARKDVTEAEASVASPASTQANSQKPQILSPGSIAAMPLAIGLVILYSKTMVEKEDDAEMETESFAANTLEINEMTNRELSSASQLLSKINSVVEGNQVSEKTEPKINESSEGTVGISTVTEAKETEFVRGATFIFKGLTVDNRPLRQTPETTPDAIDSTNNDTTKSALDVSLDSKVVEKTQSTDIKKSNNVIEAQEWINKWKLKNRTSEVSDSYSSTSSTLSDIPVANMSSNTTAVRQWIENWRANGTKKVSENNVETSSPGTEEVGEENDESARVEAEKISETANESSMNTVANKETNAGINSSANSNRSPQNTDKEFRRRLEKTSEFERQRTETDNNTPISKYVAQLDYERIFKYALATVLQFGMWLIAFSVLNMVPSKVSSFIIPKRLLVSALFLFLSFRSRVFSILDNRRPSIASEAEERKTRKRPSWTPPPIAFPIIWSSIGILRTVSSVLVWETCGRSLLASPLLSLLMHLCIGDTWNNINNVEKEYGIAVSGVCMVFVSVAAATLAYYKANPLAGLILLPSCIWIGIATCLVYSIWKINGGEEPLFPIKSGQLSSASA